jgi:hypothetical protein
MGVMSCHRKGCNNIMCDTYIPQIGYVCRECQEEFKILLQTRGFNNPTEDDIYMELVSFMEKEKLFNYSYDQDESIDNFFNKHTRD